MVFLHVVPPELLCSIFFFIKILVKNMMRHNRRMRHYVSQGTKRIKLKSSKRRKSITSENHEEFGRDVNLSDFL